MSVNYLEVSVKVASISIVLIKIVLLQKPPKSVFCLLRGTKVKSALMVQQVQRYLRFILFILSM